MERKEKSEEEMRKKMGERDRNECSRKKEKTKKKEKELKKNNGEERKKW